MTMMYTSDTDNNIDRPDLDILSAFWFANMAGIGPVKQERMMTILGGAKKAFLSSSDELITRLYNEKDKAGRRLFKQRDISLLTDMSKKNKLKDEYLRIRNLGIDFIPSWSKRYPEKLKNISHPPLQLFIRGELPDKGPCLAIVGARECTPYGRDMARFFSYRLSLEGVNIISGMAKGIDGWAHQGALESGKKTYAVLGCGVEICYPKIHEKLYHSIINNGGLISEYPTRMKASPPLFPLRNRIISGLCDGVLIVEARIRSGSLITASEALEQGKDVFVIPGRIGDELSVGCNRLIREGAMPVLTPEDILEYYSIVPHADTSLTLSAEEKAVYDHIGQVPIELSYLATLCQGTYANTHRIVLSLMKKNMIRAQAKDRYIRV